MAKTIEAVEAIWRDTRRIEKTLEGPVSVRGYILDEELALFFEGKDNGNLDGILSDYRELEQLSGKMAVIGEMDSEQHRLLAGDQLWSLFFSFRQAYGRMAVLTQFSFERKKLVDWKDDKGMNEALRRVLSEETVDRCKAKETGGLGEALMEMREAILTKARSVISSA